MKYFFILGANTTLSLAELATVFSDDKLALIQKNIAILESERKIKSDILEKIGGVIKFGLIHNELASFAIKNILQSMATFANPEKLEAKFNFGISFYGKTKINTKAIAMEFKKLLKQASINSRWVISREPTLSSVVVEQNKLISRQGVEIIIIEFNKKLLIGKTIAVQPFKKLSFRDYGRPARDDRSGMLPPKLAQIMINLAGVNLDGTIIDPFCGSGTVITEAMLMGYKNLIGSDTSDKALRNTKTNLIWLQSNFQFSTSCLPAYAPVCVQPVCVQRTGRRTGRGRRRQVNFQLFHSDATKISKHIRPNSVDAIITEPYLGPQRGRIKITKIKKELEKLYSESLREFNKILKSGGRIVMIWPVFQVKPKPHFLNPNLTGLKIINPIPENLQKNIFIKLTSRDTIVYGREEQKVWREIIMLEK